MKTLIAAALLAATLILTAIPAQATVQDAASETRPQAMPPAAPAAAAPAAAGRLPNAFDDPAAQVAARARMQTQAPPPIEAVQIGPDVKRAEDALRAFVVAAQGPGLDYAAFSPDLAERLRGQAIRLIPLIKGFGELRDVTYVGQEQSAELFALDFANARTQWIIAFNAEDEIALLLFRPTQDGATPAPAPTR